MKRKSSSADRRGKFVSSLLKSKIGAVVMFESPAENYFEISSSIVKTLTKRGFGGVYVSFQRPFKNVLDQMGGRNIDYSNLLFVDMASALCEGVHVEHPRSVHISPKLDLDELVRAIYTSVDRVKAKRKFIFIDSLTTIALYKPLSEVLRFTEFLMRIAREGSDVLLVFNVAAELSQKKFIRDVAINVDEVISYV